MGEAELRANQSRQTALDEGTPSPEQEGEKICREGLDNSGNIEALPMGEVSKHYPQRAGTRPPRRQAKGPAPKLRWMPLPALLYAQVIKTTRRRRLIRISHCAVFGTFEAVQQMLAVCGWQI